MRNIRVADPRDRLPVTPAPVRRPRSRIADWLATIGMVLVIPALILPFLAANAAKMRNDAAAERSFRDKLAASAASERAKQLPEYTTHTNDIAIALDAKRP